MKSKFRLIMLALVLMACLPIVAEAKEKTATEKVVAAAGETAAQIAATAVTLTQKGVQFLNTFFSIWHLPH